ncbi:DinB family protein [Streptomyces sp. NPDC049954]|uniref:DinB family protein n=1 Tax=Streptomyces sp. NPDC049954 TaxID=3155779 RepID=UPI00341F8660
MTSAKDGGRAGSGADGGDAEVGVLLDVLRAERRHVLEALDGLDEETLHRSVLPSGWSPLGLVRHLALDVERFWFRGVVAGEEEVVAQVLASTADDNAWRLAPGDDGPGVIGLYRAECASADAVVTARTALTPPAWWPDDQSGHNRLHTLREVLLHVVTETACHAGHLDVVRELVDGRQWLVLTE